MFVIFISLLLINSNLQMSSKDKRMIVMAMLMILKKNEEKNIAFVNVTKYFYTVLPSQDQRSHTSSLKVTSTTKR